MTHRIETVERGTTFDGRPGYAARCTNCDAITFGGFATRTEARAACTESCERAVP